MNNKRYERLPCSSYIYVIELDDWVCPAGCGCSIYNCSGVRWILTFLTPTRGIHNLVSLPYCKQHIHSYQQHCNLPNTDITNTTMLISKGGIRRPLLPTQGVSHSSVNLSRTYHVGLQPAVIHFILFLGPESTPRHGVRYPALAT